MSALITAEQETESNLVVVTEQTTNTIVQDPVPDPVPVQEIVVNIDRMNEILSNLVDINSINELQIDDLLQIKGTIEQLQITEITDDIITSNEVDYNIIMGVYSNYDIFIQGDELELKKMLNLINTIYEQQIGEQEVAEPFTNITGENIINKKDVLFTLNIFHIIWLAIIIIIIIIIYNKKAIIKFIRKSYKKYVKKYLK
jgi:hypothetical protein